MTNVVVPYPGGKSRYASWIVNSLPDHSAYVEPFGGSAAVLLNKQESEIEVINDIDSDITQFFEVLRDDGGALIRCLRSVEFSYDLYEKWTKRWYQEDWRPDDPVKRAAAFYFSRYAQWGGKYEGISGFARSASGRDKAKTFRKKVEELDWFVWRLRGVLIDNLDYREVFEKYDRDNSGGEGTVFYCDPPYMDTEHRYTSSSDGFDHQEFASELLGLEGDFLVSYGTRVPTGLQYLRQDRREVTRGIDRITEAKKAHETLIKSYPENKERSFIIGGTTGDALEADW